MGFLEFAFNALKLKELKRSGWIRKGISKPETVAGHSFFLALLCMLYAEEEHLNVKKCVELALVHDLHETICGDICSREFEHQQKVSNAKKKEIEKNAIMKFSELVPEKKRERIKSHCLEFLEQSTKEAVFVRYLDLIEMCLQALYYRENKRTKSDIGDFFRKTKRELKTETAKKVFKLIEKKFKGY